MGKKQQDHFYDQEIKNKSTNNRERAGELWFSFLSIGFIFLVLGTILYFSNCEPIVQTASACGVPTATPFISIAMPSGNDRFINPTPQMPSGEDCRNYYSFQNYTGGVIYLTIDTIVSFDSDHGRIYKIYTNYDYTIGSATGTTTPPIYSDFYGGQGSIHMHASARGNVYDTSRENVYKIKGQNPTTQAVKDYIDAVGSAFWFAKRMVNHESNFRQFDTTSGMPLPNSTQDGGYGIYQLTPPSADNQYWNWKANVDRSIQKLTDDKNRTGTDSNRRADKFWQDQVTQFNAWNAQHPNDQRTAPNNETRGGIVFSFSPTGEQKPFNDAILIQMFNDCPNGHFIVWDNETNPNNPQWRLHDTGYVGAVC